MEEEISHYVNDLNSFITNSKAKFQDILSQFNWKEEVILQSHKDEKKCADNKAKSHEGPSTTKEETTSSPFDDGVTTKEPKDSEKIYNEIMSSLPQPKVEKVDEDKMIREKLAAERDAKRRRISYKNKVHTKSKSHTEILREVIRQQMLAFEEWMSEESETRGEHGSENEIGKESANKDGVADLIDLGDVKGNSHTLWKHIGGIIRRRREIQEEEESRMERRVRKEADWEGHRLCSKKTSTSEEENREDHRKRRRRHDEEEYSKFHRSISRSHDDGESTRDRRRKSNSRERMRDMSKNCWRKHHRDNRVEERDKRDRKKNEFRRRDREKSIEKGERKRKYHRSEKWDEDKSPG